MSKGIAGVLLMVCLAPKASAQLASTTSLVGTITDSSGAVIPGATVSAVNIATNDTYNATTNAEGNYAIPFVRIGAYTITAIARGFQTARQTNVTVEVNQTVRTDFVLRVGEVSQTVTVSGGAPPIATDDPSLSEIIPSQQAVDLPLNGRDVLKLAITTPGVILGQKGVRGVPGGEDLIGAGTREIQNIVSLDGISLQNNLFSTVNFFPDPDAVAETQVQTGTYSAQYGTYIGVHANVVTKSGTNTLHGAVFEFLRNDALDARNFFENPKLPKSPLRQNQFGIEIDGPVVIPRIYDGKNKTFFMADYAGLRQRQTLPGLLTVLTPKMRAGDFSEVSTPVHDPRKAGDPIFPNNQIPSQDLSSQALNILQYEPLPNRSGLANNFLGAVDNRNITNQTIERVDHNLSDNARLLFRFQWQKASLVNGAGNPFAAINQPEKDYGFVAGYTHTITPRVVNDFRIGLHYVRIDSLNIFGTPSLADAGTNLGIPGFKTDINNPGLPSFSIAGFGGIGTSDGTNWLEHDSTWTVTDVLSYLFGGHSIAVGAEFNRLSTWRTANNAPRGNFLFSGAISGHPASDFVLGLPFQVTTPGPLVPGVFVEWRDAFFFQDKWQVRPKLTLNLGLRYELPTAPRSLNNVWSLLNRNQTAFVSSMAADRNFPLRDSNHKDWAPRLGFAYRATPRTVVRGGYGLYYNSNQLNTWTLMTTNPPFSTIFTFNSLPSNPTLSLSNPTPPGSLVNQAPNAFTVNPDLPTAYMSQWSLDVERALWHNAGLDIQYLGSHSMHLDRSFFNNTPLPAPGPVDARRPNQLFRVIRTIQNDEIANYGGLNVVLRQRTNHGLTMLLTYTWSHTLDVSNDSNTGGAPMDPYNWRGDYGNANWDIRHRFVASYIYDLPFFKSSSQPALRWTLANWQINGITIIQTGTPFNVTIPRDVANTGVGNQRPNLVGQATANCGQGNLSNCISAGAFATPAQFTYGNAGRNMLFGPGLISTDFSVFKNIPLTEKARLQFRTEFFNLFNTPAFANPNAVFGTPVFGSIASTVRNNREIQFAAKIVF